MSRQMLKHYSQVRMAAKRQALEGLEVGFIQPLPDEDKTASEGQLRGLRHNPRHKGPAFALAFSVSNLTGRAAGICTRTSCTPST
jgi:hypothetical protein